jgi:transposase
MLKLYIYGYLNRVQSSRRLEREAGRNLEVVVREERGFQAGTG